MNINTFEYAVSGIDQSILDKYFEKRYELTQKRAVSKIKENAPARNVVSRRLLIAAAAASLIFSLAVLPLAFDLAKDNAKEKNNVTIPTEPLAPTTALTGNAALTSPDITEPEATAKPQKIVYKEGELPKTVDANQFAEAGWITNHSNGYFFFYFDATDFEYNNPLYKNDRKTVYDDSNKDSLFYLAIDCNLAAIFYTEEVVNGEIIFRENASAIEDFIEMNGKEAYHAKQEEAMITRLNEIGVDKSRILERGHGIITCYITRSEVEILEKTVAPGYNMGFLLPKGYTLSDFYDNFYYNCFLDPQVPHNY